MAIKGVSDVVRLPRLGKIKLGIKKETDTGTSYPSPVDHFVCPNEVKRVFGEKPKELRIMFPTEDDSQWATQYLKCYSASRGLICRGDGETAIARVDIKTGEIATRDAQDTELREIGCDPDSCLYYQRGQCRRVMNLQFLLPDCPGFGVYQLNTSSFHSIVNINSSLKLIRGICQRVSMIPLSLKLVEQEVQPEGKRKKVHVLNLTASYTLTEIQKYAQIPPGQILLLPPPDTEAPEDLFSQQVLGQGEMTDEIPGIDEELLQNWMKVRSQIERLDLKDSQVCRWFNRFYQIDVSLKDFKTTLPDDKLTAEMLSRFSEALTIYEEKLKKRQPD
ncbi:MAG: hypothetical protein HXY36_06100 [Chloroflexi bacterium]|nr:hypothetical protein [Chloroflexota bacterium]